MQLGSLELLFLRVSKASNISLGEKRRMMVDYNVNLVVNSECDFCWL